MRRQERLCCPGKEHSQTSMLSSKLFPGSQPVLSSYPSIFLCLSFPIPLQSLFFPSFGSSPKHPTISLKQSQNALSLHPIMYPTLPGQVPPLCAVPNWVPPWTRGAGSHPPWGWCSPGTALGGQAGPRVSDWGLGAPLVSSASMLLSEQGYEPSASTPANIISTTWNALAATEPKQLGGRPFVLFL